MKNTLMPLRLKKISITLCTLLFSGFAFSQPAGMPPCAPSAAPGESACLATPICDLDGYCGRTLSSYSVDAWQTLKTAIITCSQSGFDQLDINNDSYLKFVAGSTSISFDVYVYNCLKPVTTKAIQLAVFSAPSCSGGPVDVKYCNKQMNQQATPHNVVINNLTPGETYYILIDGYSSQDCAYSFVATSGVSTGLTVNLSQTTVCPGETVTATVSGGSTYAWTGDAGLNSTSGASITITPPTTPGTYNYNVESSGTVGNSVVCPSATDYDFSITVSNGPTPTFNQVGPICTGGNFTLPATSTNGIAGTWLPAVNNTQTTTYTFTPNAGQCASSTTMTVTISNQIAPTFTQVGPICTGGNFTLPATSSNGITGIWSPAVNNTQTTTYTFTPNAGQCGAPTTMTVTVSGQITPTFDAIGPFCTGENFTLPTTSTNGITGTWSPAVNNTQTTIYTFTPTANQGSCQVTTTTMNVIIQTELSVSITPAISSICAGESITLTASGANSYTWSPATGLNTTTGPTVIASPTSTTTYSVTGVSNSGCVGTATATITVSTAPIASFTPSVTSGEAPLSVVFTNTSTNATSYIWDFGNGLGNTSTNLSVSTNYNQAGNYEVILIASNGACSDTAKANIIVEGKDVVIHVPNVFTPNGDQVNDVFFIGTNNAKTVQVLLFNRWGNTMATLTNATDSWDGGDSPSGIYFYKYTITDFENKIYEGQGFFHLERGNK